MRLVYLFCFATLMMVGCSENNKNEPANDSGTDGGDSEVNNINNSQLFTCTQDGRDGIEVDGICFLDYGVDSEFGYNAYLAASVTGGDNPPQNVIDGYATWNTRWEISGNQWVELRLPSIESINRVGLSFMKGDEYPFIFTITASVDRQNWVTVYDGQSSGESSNTEYFYLDTAVDANHIRVELNGNTANSMNYLQEIRWGNQSEPHSYPQSSLTPSDSCSYYNSNLASIPGPIFISTFENGASNPEVGDTLVNTEGGSTLDAVDNPFTDSCNGSGKVLEVISLPNGSNAKTRAEYHNAPRMPLNERTYIYTWKQYFPEDFLNELDVNWMIFSQWKTWPCGWYDSPSASDYPSDSPINYSSVNYDNYICEGGGIFNHLSYVPSRNTLSFEARARPDCAYLEHQPIEGQWNTYILEVYWTNTDNGYYKLFLNGEIIAEAQDVKTLFDLHPGINGYSTCDMYWGLGVYSSWTSNSINNFSVYFDDIAIFDKDQGATLEQLCPGCPE
ncbi:heparin lyase I family protein [Myxococcota bacterium]|nr:heparin lyase I family protein [Myxococcota bacterium]MBU1381054.1 heparin lyase I family protein [Myxococcota bacterium]MBU1495433.1 heparin lyase I family protein [Myxococcota bacterium]